MIVTARQLEDIHRQNGGNGQITLPYRARLTPLASDWVRSRKIAIGYSDVEMLAGKTTAPVPTVSATSNSDGSFLWWCDGPCGAAKAAVAAQAKESGLTPLDRPAEAKQLVPVVKQIAQALKQGKNPGAILLVQNGALATIFTNRCPSIRAVLGTCLEAVEQGVQQAAANVLIIEYPYKTLQQMRNLLSRFTRGRRQLAEEVRRQLEELASCA